MQIIPNFIKGFRLKRANIKLQILFRVASLMIIPSESIIEEKKSDIFLIKIKRFLYCPEKRSKCQGNSSGHIRHEISGGV